MKKVEYKLCNFNIPTELCDWLKEKSQKEFMSMTQYIIELIKQQIKKDAEQQ